MDSIDLKILHCLSINAREKVSTISKYVNLSVSAVIERIKKMEVSGVIKQYLVILDQKNIGNNIIAVMKVKLSHPQYYKNFSECINNNPNVCSCYSIRGTFDFFLKIICKSHEHLEQICHDIRTINGVYSFELDIVLKTLKEDICCIPDDIVNINI